MLNITRKLIVALMLGSLAVSSCAKSRDVQAPEGTPYQNYNDQSTAAPPPDASVDEEKTKSENPGRADKREAKKSSDKTKSKDFAAGLANNSNAAPYAQPQEMPVAPSVIAVAPSEKPPAEPTNQEHYKGYTPNPWTDPAKDRLSTFSIDVDTGSYTISRRKLNEGTLPPAEAVRIEEFVNYFTYDYPQPKKGEPFSVNYEAAPSPFDAKRVLLKVGIQGKKISAEERVPAHLTFLVDVSGSMSSPDKLELIKKSLKVMVENLKPTDTVALTTYAGANRLVLEATSVKEKKKILTAIDDLQSGGSTAMASGMQLAYEQAMKTYEKGSINRVIVCSDGDANIGPISHEEILKSIAEYVEKGITMTTVGVGNGNYQDYRMEQLANKGNGNYVYLDSFEASKRFFSEQLDGTLQVIAKDVKIQVEFSDDAVAQYRLVGYENRDVADKDFRNDKVDAGEIGAGHTVTALYELQLVGKPKGPLATIRVRAKEPEGTVAKEWSYPFDSALVKTKFEQSSSDFQFVSAVVGFGEILRQNPDASEWSLDRIKELTKTNTKSLPERQEFLGLVDRATSLGAGNIKAATK